VWIGGLEAVDLRAKDRTLPEKAGGYQPEELPVWNYDGSSTGQAPGHDSEVLIRPKRIFKDPFRAGNNILVLADTWTPQGEPLPTNAREPAVKVFDQATEHHPWFGLEQEYTMFEPKTNWPLGWPNQQYPAPQGPYYCSAGADRCFGRQVVEDHYRACLFAGVKICGTNGEVMPGQWEFQIGPCEGIEMGDHLWMARYILLRVAEIHQIKISFDPKPIVGDWNGAGCHSNYSTVATRTKPGGFEASLKLIEKLSKKHAEHIQVYGEGNERRLTGRHETASITKFSHGVANRGASIRIPRDLEKNDTGYFEDRRPASNCDPYKVTAAIVQTTLLE
jgi:glutamine synthetase